MALGQYLLVAVLMAVITNSQQEELKEAMAEIVKMCKEQTGASDADIKALHEHKVPETKEGVCMFKCFFEQANVLKEGKYNPEGLVTALTPMVAGDEAKIAGIKKMSEECGEELKKATGTDCEIAQTLMSCTVKKGKSFGFEYPSEF